MADDKKIKKVDQEISGPGDQPEDAVIDHSECEQKLAELDGKYKRALADFQNLERQTREGQMRFAKIATHGFVQDLIGPYDNLLLATKHLKDKGLEMVIGQFRQVFESQGLKEINPVGSQFDPTRMEAVDTKEGEQDKVLEVMSSGYELNGIVIKHAQVIVGKKSN